MLLDGEHQVGVYGEGPILGSGVLLQLVCGRPGLGHVAGEDLVTEVHGLLGVGRHGTQILFQSAAGIHEGVRQGGDDLRGIAFIAVGNTGGRLGGGAVFLCPPQAVLDFLLGVDAVLDKQIHILGAM